MNKLHETILLVEDNPRDREFLCGMLNGEKLMIAANGKEALEMFRRDEISRVISDIQMPEINGIELAGSLWKEDPELRIVFWSHYDDEMYLRALAKIIPPETVYGYILKSNTSAVIKKAIDAVFLECQCWIDPKVRPVQARLHRADSMISDTEYETLIDLALGLTDNTIAKRRYLSRRGAQNRLKSLYGKMGIEHSTPSPENTSELLNLRTRTLSIAFQRGLINVHILEEEEKKLKEWLASF